MSCSTQTILQRSNVGADREGKVVFRQRMVCLRGFREGLHTAVVSREGRSTLDSSSRHERRRSCLGHIEVLSCAIPVSLRVTCRSRLLKTNIGEYSHMIYSVGA